MMTGTDEPLHSAIATFLLLGKLPTPSDRAGVERLATLYKAGPAAWGAAWRGDERRLRAYAAEHELRPVHLKHFYGEAIVVRAARLARGAR
jgi:hypothetical protein